MLRPPPTLLDKNPVLATALDKVSLFGTDLYIEGVPFCSQDGEYIRCAHAAAWICHYTAHLRAGVARHSTSQIASYSPAELSQERLFPSSGMNLIQLQAVFNRLGQPAHLYALDAPPTVLGADPDGAEHDPRMICRYLNSRLPVMVVTANHAFVLVGYYEEAAEGKTATRFIACDDQVGPYELIDDPSSDDRDGPWEALVIPCPPRAWLEAESAENNAYETLFAHQFAGSEEIPEEWIALAQRLDSGELRLRTMLIRGSEYKNNLHHQNRNADVVRELRLARLSNWVWVVEAHNETIGPIAEPSVIAELVYDSTSASTGPQRLAFSYPGGTLVIPPDKGKDKRINGDLNVWRSHLSNHNRPLGAGSDKQEADRDPKKSVRS